MFWFEYVGCVLSSIGNLEVHALAFIGGLCHLRHRDRPILRRHRSDHRRRVGSPGSVGSLARLAADSGPRVAYFAFRRTNLRQIDCSYRRLNGCSCSDWNGCSCSTLTIVAGNFPLTTVVGYFPPAASLALHYSWNSSSHCRTSANHYRCSCKHSHRARHTYCRWRSLPLHCSPRPC